MKNRHSDYMHWAKLFSKAPYNLATSGVGSFPLNELPFDRSQLDINGPVTYGYEPLQRAIAAHCGTVPECVVAATGASGANHLAMAAILDAGDEVLIEHPTYELLVSAALYFTPNVRRFARREDHGYRLDPRAVESAVSPRTKLIVVTNLHNPSSVPASEHDLRAIGEIARGIGARVLVDEVYLDAVYENTPRSAFHYGPHFIVTNSLTKMYGLSGLRCGWILAEPELAQSIWRLKDLFGVNAAFPTEQIAVAAFANLPLIRDYARRVLDADRAALAGFLTERRELSTVATAWGTTALPRLLHGDVDVFLHRLRSEFATTAVPGRFFEMPNHFRIGMGVNHEMFTEGLRRLGKALDAA